MLVNHKGINSTDLFLVEYKDIYDTFMYIYVRSLLQHSHRREGRRRTLCKLLSIIIIFNLRPDLQKCGFLFCVFPFVPSS